MDDITDLFGLKDKSTWKKKMVNREEWVSVEREYPPDNITVIVYSDVFDRYSLASHNSCSDDNWKNGIPAMSHWKHLPKPPWWCFNCMGKHGQMISTEMDTAICIRCGRDIEAEPLGF